MAESATDVGDKSTTSIIVEPNRLSTILEWWKLKEIWNKEGAPRLPVDIEERVNPLFLAGDNVQKRADEMLAQALKRSASQKSGSEK